MPRIPNPDRAVRIAAASVAASLLMLAGCGDRKDPAADAVAARVDGEQISQRQVDLVVQQQRNLRPEQLDAAGRQALERLIDQQIAVRRAGELKLEQEPAVALQLEAARREVLARAYVEKVGEGAARPSADEVRQYYDAKPALFRERRIYNLQELLVEARPEQIETLRSQLAAAKNVGEFAEYLRANEFRFVAHQAVRAAEQLPLQNLELFSRLQDGQATMVPAPNGVQVVVLLGSRMQPVTEEQARPMIEQFLLNERRRKLVEDDLRSLRASAKIERLGKFAGAAASAPAGAASR